MASPTDDDQPSSLQTPYSGWSPSQPLYPPPSYAPASRPLYPPPGYSGPSPVYPQYPQQPPYPPAPQPYGYAPVPSATPQTVMRTYRSVASYQADAQNMWLQGYSAVNISQAQYGIGAGGLVTLGLVGGVLTLCLVCAFLPLGILVALVGLILLIALSTTSGTSISAAYALTHAPVAVASLGPVANANVPPKIPSVHLSAMQQFQESVKSRWLRLVSAPDWAKWLAFGGTGIVIVFVVIGTIWWMINR